MSKEINSNEQEKKMMVKFQGGGSDTVYAIGMIGAWVYYISRATTFQQRAIGFFKGIVWPAFLVYRLFEFLNKDNIE